MNHFYEEIDEHIQWLINFMNEEYPNNYELVIDNNSGTIRSTLQAQMFLRNDLRSPVADMPKSNVSEVPKEIFEDLKLAKQYLSELINIVDSFGLDDIYSCGQHDYACKNCKHFSEHLNHNLCEDYEFFVWKHKQDAIDLINKVEK